MEKSQKIPLQMHVPYSCFAVSGVKPLTAAQKEDAFAWILLCPPFKKETPTDKSDLFLLAPANEEIARLPPPKKNMACGLRGLDPPGARTLGLAQEAQAPSVRCPFGGLDETITGDSDGCSLRPGKKRGALELIFSCELD